MQLQRWLSWVSLAPGETSGFNNYHHEDDGDDEDDGEDEDEDGGDNDDGDVITVIVVMTLDLRFQQSPSSFLV